MVKKLLTIFGFIIMLCSLTSCGTTNINSQGHITFNIVDIKNGSVIDNADIRFIITDINKEYNISENKQINIPAKKMDKPSSYPYGYTTITSVKGYYPRIDHNFKIGANVDAVITLEMTPIGELENSSFVEVFHESSAVEMVEFLNYYKLSDIY